MPGLELGKAYKEIVMCLTKLKKTDLQAGHFPLQKVKKMQEGSCREEL